MMNILAKYQWPGNIRQLRNVVLTSLILGTGKTLSLADVSWLFDELQPLPQKNDFTLTESVLFDEKQTAKSQDLGGIPLAKIERRAILDTLKKTDGNQTRAADILGISDRTLRDKIKRYRSEGVLQLT
jgi:two-component system response regulator FlrC